MNRSGVEIIDRLPCEYKLIGFMVGAVHSSSTYASQLFDSTLGHMPHIPVGDVMSLLKKPHPCVLACVYLFVWQWYKRGHSSLTSNLLTNLILFSNATELSVPDHWINLSAGLDQHSSVHY